MHAVAPAVAVAIELPNGVRVIGNADRTRMRDLQLNACEHWGRCDASATLPTTRFGLGRFRE